MIALVLKTVWGFLSKLPWWVYVVLAALIYHFAAIHHYSNVAREECNAAWQKKEAQAEASYQAEVAKLQAKARAKEAEWETKITEQGVQYANDLKDQEDQSSRDVAAARSGALKLRVRTGAVQAGGSGGSQAPADPSKPQPTGTTELPSEVTGRLYALADDADRVTKKFNACLAILEAERK